MSYKPNALDYALLLQSERMIMVRVELISKDGSIIDRIEGHLVSDGYSVDATSSIRRTNSLTFVVTNDNFTVGEKNYIWFANTMRVYIGVYSYKAKDYLWYLNGRYLWDEAAYTYDPQTATLSLNCLDLMATFTESGGSPMSGAGTQIDEGSSIKNVVTETVKTFGGFTEMDVNVSGDVPYDMKYGTNVYPIQLLEDLRDLNVGYEMFFDDDIFVMQKYPTAASDPIVLTADQIAPLVQSESRSVSFSAVKNVSEIWGGYIDADHYTSSTNAYGLTLNAVLQTGESLVVGDIVVFKTSFDFTWSSYAGFSVTWGTGGTGGPIVDSTLTPIQSGSFTANVWYAIRYLENNKMEYLGVSSDLYQVSSVDKLVSCDPHNIFAYCPDQPANNLYYYSLKNEPTKNITYTIDADNPYALDKIGERRQVLSDGEYANIYSNDLATQRAKYENWRCADMLDSITLTMIDIPWLDVNQKIEYKPNNASAPSVYMVKRKSGSSANGTMTIECTKFKPIYSWDE